MLDLGAGIVDLVGWIVSIATLDMRRMSPVAMIFSVLFFGCIGLVLTIAPVVRLLEGPSWAETLGLLFALALGVAMLARLCYGIFDLWRGYAADRAKETER